MKTIEYWLERRVDVLGEVQKLKEETKKRLAISSTAPFRIRLRSRDVRSSYIQQDLALLKDWRLAYNSWRKRRKSLSNSLKKLRGLQKRLAYIEERIRILTKTKSQLLREDPFT